MESISAIHCGTMNRTAAKWAMAASAQRKAWEVQVSPSYKE